MSAAVDLDGGFLHSIILDPVPDDAVSILVSDNTGFLASVRAADATLLGNPLLATQIFALNLTYDGTLSVQLTRQSGAGGFVGFTVVYLP